MNKPPANLMVAVAEKVVCVKISGRADFTSSLDLKKLIAELWERGYKHFIFELSECLNMDSTFLGVLSGIGLKLSHGKNVKNGESLELLNPSPRIRETLENLGVDGLFSIKICNDPLPDNYRPLPETADKSRLEVTRNCLDAHETLMAIKPENIGKFKDVAQFLAEDIKRLEAEKRD